MDKKRVSQQNLNCKKKKVTYCTIEDVKVEEECLAYLMQGSIILQAHKYSQVGVQYWATGQTFLEYENAPSDHLCENLCSEATFPGLDSAVLCTSSSTSFVV